MTQLSRASFCSASDGEAVRLCSPPIGDGFVKMLSDDSTLRSTLIVVIITERHPSARVGAPGWLNRGGGLAALDLGVVSSSPVLGVEIT